MKCSFGYAPPTHTQLQVLEFMLAFQAEHGSMPTRVEIAGPPQNRGGST